MSFWRIGGECKKREVDLRIWSGFAIWWIDFIDLLTQEAEGMSKSVPDNEKKFTESNFAFWPKTISWPWKQR